MANMDKRWRFFKPFNRLGAAFAAKVQLPGVSRWVARACLTVAGNGA